MSSILFYTALREYLETRKITIEIDRVFRKKVIRVAENFVLQDNKLFYTGPSRLYMRLVVMTDEQKRVVLEECHRSSDTGIHFGVRSTRDRVISGYYWTTLKKDVTDWVKSCNYCQTKHSKKTVTQIRRPIKVKEAWEVVAIELIGPLRETARKNQYVLTMTDLHTKWVVAEPLQSKSASEVSAALISKMYLFGMVRKIISDEGKEFVSKLNSSIFETVNIKDAVSGACHRQTNGQDECTSQSIKCVLRKYASEERDDWDVHLQAIVYGINTAKQKSTQYSPYYLLFNRHPRLPAVMNAPPFGETLEVQITKKDLDRRLTDNALNEKVVSNTEKPHSQREKSFSEKKGKRTRQCSLEAGVEVLSSEEPKKLKVGDILQNSKQGQLTLNTVSAKAVAADEV